MYYIVIFSSLLTDEYQVSRYFVRAMFANPLGPRRASQGRRESSLKPRYVTRSICGRVTGPPRVIRLRDPSRTGGFAVRECDDRCTWKRLRER